MKLLKMARELITITEYLRDKYGIYYAEGNLFDFDELWGSTALGFGGVGGSAMTWARTYVFIPEGIEEAYVFFGDRFAYKGGMMKIIGKTEDGFILEASKADVSAMEGLYEYQKIFDVGDVIDMKGLFNRYNTVDIAFNNIPELVNSANRIINACHWVEEFRKG